MDIEAETKAQLPGKAAAIRANHFTAALLLQIPELQISDPESMQLAAAWIAMEREFPALVLTPRQQAIFALVTAGSMVYVPRIAIIAGKVAATAKARRAARTNPANFPDAPVNQPEHAEGVYTPSGVGNGAFSEELPPAEIRPDGPVTFQ